MVNYFGFWLLLDASVFLVIETYGNEKVNFDMLGVVGSNPIGSTNSESHTVSFARQLGAR